VLRSRSFGILATFIFLFAHDPALAGEPVYANSELDRVAYAVDGAESSHGKDRLMWRPDAAGPQGPMQVSEKAAIDVGGGDRFEVGQNRAIGRAYLALLHRRYGNWPDAISAYNWGLGRLDLWIRGGRPPEKLVGGVSRYVHRVLHDSKLCDTATDCGSQYPMVGSLPITGGRHRPYAFDRSLAQAEKLAAQFGGELGQSR
jgi:hypothetical protein